MSSSTRIPERIRFRTQYSLILVFWAVLTISVVSVKCEEELGGQTEGSGTENIEGEDDGDGGEDGWDEAGAEEDEEDGGEDEDEGSGEEEYAAAAAPGGEGDDDEKRRRCGNKARWVKCGKRCPVICNRRTRACRAGCFRGCRCIPGFIFKNRSKRNCVRRRNCPRRRG